MKEKEVMKLRGVGGIWKVLEGERSEDDINTVLMQEILKQNQFKFKNAHNPLQWEQDLFLVHVDPIPYSGMPRPASMQVGGELLGLAST